MTTWLTFVAMGILASLAAALFRVWRGPGRADRMMGAQLAGTGGVAVLMLLAPLSGRGAIDVALVLALFAALAAVGFVKAVSADGGGDPEEDAAYEGLPPQPERTADNRETSDG